MIWSPYRRNEVSSENKGRSSREVETKNRQEAKQYYGRKAKIIHPLEISQPMSVNLKPDDKEGSHATVVQPITDRSSVVVSGDKEYHIGLVYNSDDVASEFKSEDNAEETLVE